MLLRPTRAAVVKTRTDQHAVRVLRNELNEHIRPGHVVWGASKFSNKPGAKVEPQWYAFFVMEVRMPRGDSLEVTIVGKWLHKLEYLQRCDRKGLIGEKWSGRGNVWFFTNQSQTLGAHLVLSAVTTVPVRIGSDGALFDARSGVKVPAYLSDDTFTAVGPCDDVILSQDRRPSSSRAGRPSISTCARSASKSWATPPSLSRRSKTSTACPSTSRSPTSRRAS